MKKKDKNGKKRINEVDSLEQYDDFGAAIEKNQRKKFKKQNWKRWENDDELS